MRFWDTEEGKILSHGIHEHSNGQSLIINSVSIMKRLIENGNIRIEGEDSNIEMFTKSLDLIIKGKERNKEAIDYIYTKFKNNFEI